MPLTLEQYLELLDWTGRRFAPRKRGAIPATAPPILARLGIAEGDWLQLAGNFGRLFHHLAGRPATMAHQRKRRGRRFRDPGAPLLGTAGK